MSEGPISMGVKGTPLDWSNWEKRCKEAFGRVLMPNHVMTKDELLALGFRSAAAGKNVYGRGPGSGSERGGYLGAFENQRD